MNIDFIPLKYFCFLTTRLLCISMLMFLYSIVSHSNLLFSFISLVRMQKSFLYLLEVSPVSLKNL